MPIATFEIACVVIVLATLAVMGRTRDRRVLLYDYAALAIGAYVGEQTCISFYRFYGYATAWDAFVGSVPILVPLIWPLVVLSARDVARSLLPSSAGVAQHAFAVFVIVSLDASLVEVVAVRAGLWSWTEPGHLGVPLVGILGWGFFAAGTSLSRRRLTSVLAGFALTHALVLLSWWTLFRWTARGDLRALGFVPLGIVSALCTIVAIRARLAGRPLLPAVWGPRILAAGLFFVLLATTAPREAPLLVHTVLVALPYLAATSFRGTRSAGARRAATSSSPRGT